MGDSTLESRDGILANRTSPIQVGAVPKTGNGISDQGRGGPSGQAMGSMVQGFINTSSKEEREIDHEIHFTFDKDTPGTRRDCALLERYLKQVMREHKYLSLIHI